MYMAFTDQERQKIFDALREKGVSSKCPACGHNTLFLTEFISWLPVKTVVGEDERELSMEGGLPAIVIACDNCGYIMTFHLSGLGLWDDFIKQKQER